MGLIRNMIESGYLPKEEPKEEKTKTMARVDRKPRISNSPRWRKSLPSPNPPLCETSPVSLDHLIGVATGQVRRNRARCIRRGLKNGTAVRPRVWPGLNINLVKLYLYLMFMMKCRLLRVLRYMVVPKFKSRMGHCCNLLPRDDVRIPGIHFRL